MLTITTTERLRVMHQNAEMMAEEINRLKAENSRLLKKTSFDEMSTEAAFSGITENVISQIVEEVKPYYLTGFHKYLSAIVRESRNKKSHLRFAESMVPGGTSITYRATLPEVTVEVSAFYFT